MSSRLPPIQLSVLGITLHVDCESASCRLGIERYFGAHVVAPEHIETPDLILRITAEEFDRYFFRERPPAAEGEPLPGVETFVPGSQSLVPWTSRFPPLVPYHHTANTGRFVAIHAACISLGDRGCLLLPGNRGAGKTSCSRILCNRPFLGRLLTDEAAFMHRRTSVVEPLTLAMGVVPPDAGSPRRKIPMAASDVCERLEPLPQPVVGVIVLRKVAGSSGVRRLRPPQAIRGMVEHAIEVGASVDETVVTVARLAVRSPVYELRWADLDSLPILLEEAISRVAASNRESAYVRSEGD